MHDVDYGLRAAALQIAAQLPDNIDDAMAVLSLAALVVGFLARSPAQDREQVQARLLAFPGPGGAPRNRSDTAGGR